jgi:DNA-binding beta-propeller fold protein YncE
VAVDPTGRFAYVVNVADSGQLGAVSAFSIGPNGALTPLPGSPFAAGVLPQALALDPTGNFLYLAGSSSVTVQIVSIGNNIYTLKAEGKGVDLDCLANSVTVGLTIGIDSGSTAVRAEFEKRKKRDHRDEDWHEHE